MKEVIGIIGPVCSGKDLAGGYLSEKLDIPTYQISSPLRKICNQRGLPIERENLIKIDGELAGEYGDECLARHILDNSTEKRLIITGMRQLGQIALLNSETNLFLLSIDASSIIRFDRSRYDKKIGEASDIKLFRQREIDENRAPSLQRLFDCMQKADYEIINDGSIYFFQKKLDQVAELINEKFDT